MSIVNLNNVGQTFGDFDVFAGVNASIAHGGKIGLVGPNGVGKTTLLLALAGIAAPSSGNIHRARGLTIGYLRQEAMEAFAERDNTLYAEMRTVFVEVEALESRLREMETQMANDYSPELLERYGNAQERFEAMGGYDYEVRIEKTLDGLGFRAEHYDLPLRVLSGGQKTRALLARLLLERPGLLILDEPTNHLDSDAVEWLEGTLHNWEGALLVVSHDRYFLDNVVNTIWEMSRAGIESYRGNYSAYVRQRQERFERNYALYEAEKERMEKELDYIRRNIARASTNGMAVGRLKRLSRDLIAIEQLGIMGVQGKRWSETGVGSIRPLTVQEAEHKLKEVLNAPNNRPHKLAPRLNTGTRGGEIVLRTNDLFVGYPDNPLFTADDIVLNRLECAALIGPNGVGKTTFLKTLLGQLPALGGRAHVGVNVKVGYFAQAHDGLDPALTLVDELMRHKPMKISEARAYLAPYLFRGDDAFKIVGELSGGERARLALAILALDGANFLLLDEPTNHLDITAQESLQETLEAFEGTVLLVSHDRYLVEKLASQIWDLRDGHLTVFKGPYREYLAAREAGELVREKA